jgi:CspA family cold shock protein
LVMRVRHGALALNDLLRARSFDVSQGTIKKVMDKGFGFIEGERGDIFFHSSAVVGTTFDTLREGQQVEYSEGRGPKGPCAENVKVIS